MATKKKTKAKKPKQKALPGMEDRAIAALEAVAEQYAEIRDKRMGLTKKEVELNDELLTLMKKNGKAEYHHGDVHCWIKAKDERVKVKIGEIEIKAKSKATDFEPPSDDEIPHSEEIPDLEEEEPEYDEEAEAS